MSEMTRVVSRLAREQETVTREQNRKDQDAWRAACSAILALPGLRGFWPMSAVAYTNPQGLDISANGNHLTNNNVSTFGHTGLISHVTFNGTTQYLSKADGGAANWADIIGTEAYIDAGDRGLTLGGWFKIDVLSRTENSMSKGSAGIQAYILNKQAGINDARFQIWSGAAGTVVSSLPVTSFTSIAPWWFWAGRFIPSTSLTVFLNNLSNTNVAAIPATIDDTAANFAIGGDGAGALLFDGLASLCWLCAAALPNVTMGALFQQQRALFRV